MAPPVAEAQRSDVDGSFESVYRAHVRDVYGFSLGLLGNVADAEDVTQTTFLNAYRALRRGEDVQSMRAWLLAIAHNVCRQRFRTASRRPQEIELDAEAAEAFTPDDDAPSAQEIRRAMSQLAFNQRTVLVLREIEGLSYEEIAHAMDLSLSAVETLLFRARRALREQLEAADHDLGCDAVERLISLQLDGKLSRSDGSLLRAHLRTCGECARVARSQRARKRVMPGLAAVPLPASLAGAFEGGAAFVTSKVAAVAVAAVLVGAGALVESGMLAKPAEAGERERAIVRVAEARPVAAPTVAPRTALNRALARQAAMRERAKAAALQAAKKAEKKKKSGAGKRPAAASSQSSGSGSGGGTSASTPVAGGGGSGVAVLPPPPPAVSDPVGTVGGAVGSAGGAAGEAADTVGGTVDAVGGTVGGAVEGAKDKLPPLPASPVQPPSLPPVSLPGTGSLP